MIYFIYRLEYTNGNTFYIGITNNLNRRYKEHKKFFSRFLFDIKVIEEIKGSKKEAEKIELKWINEYKNAGVELQNFVYNRPAFYIHQSPLIRISLEAHELLKNKATKIGDISQLASKAIIKQLK